MLQGLMRTYQYRDASQLPNTTEASVYLDYVMLDGVFLRSDIEVFCKIHVGWNAFYPDVE